MSDNSHMPDGISKLIESVPTQLIGSRFLVKLSKMDNGVDPVQYLIAIHDLLENNFTIKCHKNYDTIVNLINALRLV